MAALVAFGLMFSGLGMAALAEVPWGHARTHLAARTWPAAQATVHSVSLDEQPVGEGSDLGASWQLVLTASYGFEVGDVLHEGSRVSLEDTGSLDDRRLKALYARLQFARVTGRTVPVFYNPADPAEALLDRGFAWKPAAMAGGLGVLFLALGAAFGSAALRKGRPRG